MGVSAQTLNGIIATVKSSKYVEYPRKSMLQRLIDAEIFAAELRLRHKFREQLNFKNN